MRVEVDPGSEALRHHAGRLVIVGLQTDLNSTHPVNLLFLTLVSLQSLSVPPNIPVLL